MVCRILANSQLGRPDPPPNFFFFTLRVFIFIIYLAHFSSAGLYVGCIDLHFLFCLSDKKERRWEDVFRQQLYTVCVCRAQITVRIIHLAISGKAFEQRRAKKGKFLEDPTEKVGKTWTLLHTHLEMHHARKRTKRRLLVYFIPYFSSFLISSS
jgi:hypothetical protein